MPAPRKADPKQRVIKIIVSPTMDESLQSIKAETGILAAEHVRNAIDLYLSFRVPGKGVNLPRVQAIARKIIEEMERQDSDEIN